jgi:hypothetical protein
MGSVNMTPSLSRLLARKKLYCYLKWTITRTEDASETAISHSERQFEMSVARVIGSLERYQAHQAYLLPAGNVINPDTFIYLYFKAFTFYDAKFLELVYSLNMFNLLENKRFLNTI